MADVAVLTLKIASSQAEAAAKRTESTLNRLDMSAKQVGQSFQSLGLKMSAAITAPFALTARAAIKASASYEKARISFGVFVGDMRKGAKVFDDIVQLAARTPLNVGSLQDSAQILLATGAATADTLIPMLENLGNISRADSSILQRLALNLGQVASQTKLTGRELRDFAVAGVPLLQTLASQMNRTTSEIQDMVSKGEIGFEDVTRAFQAMTQEGGKFGGLMERLSQTLAGKWTTTIDNITMTLAGFADLFNRELKAVLDIIIRAAQWFSNLSDEIKRAIVIAGAVLASIGPILLGIAGLGTLFAGISAAIAGLAAAIPVLLKIAAVVGIISFSANQTRKAFNMTWKDVLKGASDFFGKVVGFFVNFQHNVDLIINWFKKNWSNLWTGLITNAVRVLMNLWENFKIGINFISEVVGAFVGWGIDKIKYFTSNAKVIFARWARQISTIFFEVGNKIAEAIRRGLTGRTAKSADISVFSSFMKGAAMNAGMSLKDRITEIWKNTDFVPLTADVKWDVDPFPKLKLDGLQKEVNRAKDMLFGIININDLISGQNKFKQTLLEMAMNASGEQGAALDESPSNKLAGALEAGSSEAFKLLTSQRDEDEKKLAKKNLTANERSAMELRNLNTNGVKVTGLKVISSFR